MMNLRGDHQICAENTTWFLQNQPGNNSVTLLLPRAISHLIVNNSLIHLKRYTTSHYTTSNYIVYDIIIIVVLLG